MTNYFSQPSRASPLNVATVRILLSVYLLWKILSYDWGALAEWPVYLIPYHMITPPEVAPVSAAVAVVSLCGVLVGYRLRLTAFVAAVTVSHLGIVRGAIGLSGAEQSMQIAAYILLFFALYSETDRIGLDALREAREASMDELNQHLQSHPREETYSMAVLKYSLLAIAIIYFGSGLGKVIKGPFAAWIRPESLARHTVFWKMTNQPMPLMDVFLSSELLQWASTIGTFVLELGLLVAVLAGVAIWPLLVGLAGMHAAIAAALAPFFLDQIIFLAFFVPWDRVYSRLSRDDSLDVVYDEHCYFCAQSLYLVPFLDCNDTVTFYSQYTVPDEYRAHDEADFESAMFAFRDGNAYRGYWAFRELLRQFCVFAPIVWFMGLSPVSSIGERVYRYIADNRDRHFTCSVDLSD